MDCIAPRIAIRQQLAIITELVTPAEVAFAVHIIMDCIAPRIAIRQQLAGVMVHANQMGHATAGMAIMDREAVCRYNNR